MEQCFVELKDAMHSTGKIKTAKKISRLFPASSSPPAGKRLLLLHFFSSPTVSPSGKNNIKCQTLSTRDLLLSLLLQDIPLTTGKLEISAFFSKILRLKAVPNPKPIIGLLPLNSPITNLQGIVISKESLLKNTQYITLLISLHVS